jgi:hypothetical protein
MLDLEHRVNSGRIARGSVEHAVGIGSSRLLGLIFDSPPFVNLSVLTGFSDRETFTLRHNDLDLQNVLVDEEGNVTGILDWDGCIAVPRCIGSVAVPRFLCTDWLPRIDLERSPHMAWKLKEYRNEYATALENCGCTDAPLYTRKSAMYQAAIATITYDYEVERLLSRVLSEISEVRGVNLDSLAEILGHKWMEMEGFLADLMGRLFGPDEPMSSGNAKAEDGATQYDCHS